MKIRKAVITAAGYGTRFLPVTRSQPKEMLPIVNKPLIQFAVEEALNSGIEQIIIITSQGKRAIENYFDRCFELETFLEKKGEFQRLKEMQELSNLADICYIRQKEQSGLGNAILLAKEIIGKEPFAVLLPDIIIDSPTSVIKRLIEVFDKYNSGIITVASVSNDDISKYGIIEPKQVNKNIYRIMSLVEKPDSLHAPSNLGIVGRYILQPEIFDTLKNIKPGVGQEIQLTDALQLLLNQQELYAYKLDEMHYDCGTPYGWLKANIDMALKREDIGPELKKYLNKILQK